MCQKSRDSVNVTRKLSIGLVKLYNNIIVITFAYLIY